MQVGRKIGAYEIIAKLGEGGMGEVYRARDTRLGREVALKVLPATFVDDPDRLARFEREARAVAALSHPNILAIHDFARDNGVAYAIFELLEGATLRERLKTGPLPARKAAAIAAQVARGLDAAHSRGIIHRDIKPENLLITSAGLVKILDFGIARVDEPAGTADTRTVNLATAPGQTIGTVSYMAPEQLRGKAVTPASDLFAVGVVLHEMISGRRPFDRDSHAATIAATLQEDAATLPAGTPSALARIVDRLLEKEPEDRFRSALDLAFALEALSGDTGSGSATALRPARKSHRKTAAIAAALVLAAGIGWAVGRSSRPAESAGAPTFDSLTFRRGTVFQARFGPRGTIVYSAAWDGQPVEIFETSGLQPETRALGLAPANLFAVSPSGEVALALAPRFPLTYFHPGRLATVAIGGGAPHELAEEDVSAADYTPDGRELAIARVVAGVTRVELPIGHVLYSSQADRDPVSSLRVSPDGNRVAFWHGHTAMMLTVVDRAGSKRDLLTQRILGRGLAWLRDGSEVWAAVQRRSVDPARLIAVPADGGGEPREVLKLPSSLRLYDISAEGDVLLTLVDSTATLHVQTAGGVASDRSWFRSTLVNDISPDGAFLLFHDTPAWPHPQGLFHRSVAAGSPVRIAEGQLSAQSPRLSADGKRAVFLRDGKVTIAPLAGQSRELVTPSQAMDMLAWNGSTHVVYAAQDGGVYRQSADGTSAGTLVAKMPCTGGPVTSTDGRLACSDPGGQITVIGVDGSNKRTIKPNENPGRLIGWTNDNRQLYSYLEGSNPTWIARTDLDSGRVTRFADISPADGTGASRIHPVRVTPDGRVIAYSVAREISHLYRYKGLK
jgi:eukaryotic-like serine/threonine-protein kinase